ncbi:hypothetical protein PEC106664_35380 [Pectobacterium carotovorum subsp. carotovorum]|nr:hypothetical protein PEC106664_35380 [Pectobacterium carotovorum subsp. carotovorum]
MTNIIIIKLLPLSMTYILLKDKEIYYYQCNFR